MSAHFKKGKKGEYLWTSEIYQTNGFMKGTGMTVIGVNKYSQSYVLTKSHRFRYLLKLYAL